MARGNSCNRIGESNEKMVQVAESKKSYNIAREKFRYGECGEWQKIAIWARVYQESQGSSKEHEQYDIRGEIRLK